MASIEERLKYLEDKAAIEDALKAYCTAVDSLSDMVGMLKCFTEDAVLDLSGIGLPKFTGHDQIRGFFTQVFGDMSHHAHFATNVVVNRLADDEAKVNAYVMGMGKAYSGLSVLVYVKYWLEFVRTGDGWKMKYFGEAAMMPMGDAVSAIHARD
ncbi:MAG: nuclear transport factor 2 family protein [Steroidobacteraceae bacterium]